MTILTLNCALIVYTIFGIPVFSFSEKHGERYVHILQMLQKSEEDVVFLQEISPYYTRQLQEHISTIYPYVAYGIKEDGGIVNSNILILSKKPITGIQFIPFTKQGFFEQFFTHKGFLKVVIENEKDREQSFIAINTHLAAYDGSLNWRSRGAMKTRNKQIDQIYKYIAKLEKETTSPIILGGDMNISQTRTPHNYAHMTKYFRDLFIYDESINGKDDIQNTTPASVDGRQVLVTDNSPQRIDSFFVPNDYDLAQVSELRVEILDYSSKSLSDHNPMILKFKLKR